MASPPGTSLSPPLITTPPPEPHEASNANPQSGPRPSAPFPLFPRINGGGPGSARGRTFFAKKGKDAAARAAGTSGSDSRHEWVMAPPHRDSRAGAGMSPGVGGLSPKMRRWGGALLPSPGVRRPCPCALGVLRCGLRGLDWRSPTRAPWRPARAEPLTSCPRPPLGGGPRPGRRTFGARWGRGPPGRQNRVIICI